MKLNPKIALVLAAATLAAAAAAPAGQRGGSVNVRSSSRTSVNRNSNVNVNRNTNVNVNRHTSVHVDVDHHYGYGGGCCYHPVATAAAVAVTAAVIGSVVYSVPPSCQTVYVNGVTYSQCGSTWYQPQFVGTTTTYVVVAAPR